MEVKSGEYEISNMEASYANANRPLPILKFCGITIRNRLIWIIVSYTIVSGV